LCTLTHSACPDDPPRAARGRLPRPRRGSSEPDPNSAASIRYEHRRHTHSMVSARGKEALHRSSGYFALASVFLQMGIPPLVTQFSQIPWIPLQTPCVFWAATSLGKESPAPKRFSPRAGWRTHHHGKCHSAPHTVQAMVADPATIGVCRARSTVDCCASYHTIAHIVSNRARKLATTLPPMLFVWCWQVGMAGHRGRAHAQRKPSAWRLLPDRLVHPAAVATEDG